ncbi:MAG TPA: crotonase/enoyl-CoA hydratase family protein [Rhizomicrobium sp.]|jgi:enoyl-CoA hydratase/carnithine racemase|nr:crotonase/enoyl-CoA hydratase family protein [Rhizomicrobium sp.]
MDYTQILYEVKDKILTITLHRPDKLNAFTGVMMQEMIDAFDRANKDDDIRAIVVTGSGRAFCAGADLSAGGSTFDRPTDGKEIELSDERIRDGGGLLTLKIFESLKPVIGAINGPAVGIGVTMQCAMDIRIASENARFGFVFSRRGIVPEAASSWFLPKIVGIAQALEWTFTGRVFDAQEALRGGLVKQVVPADKLLETAYALAAEIRDNTSPVSVALIRQMLWNLSTADHPMEAHKIDSRGIFVRGKSPDVREGVTSFLEKRPAAFPQKVSSDMPSYYPWIKEPKYS